MTASAADAAKAKAAVAVASTPPAAVSAAPSAPAAAAPAPVVPTVALSDLARRSTPMERRDAQLISADLQSWAEILFNHSAQIAPEVEALVTALDRPRRDLNLEAPNVLGYAQVLNDKIDSLKALCEPLTPLNAQLSKALELCQAQVARGAAMEKRRDAAREMARDGLQKLRHSLNAELQASKSLLTAQHHKNVHAIQLKHGKAPAVAQAQAQAVQPAPLPAAAAAAPQPAVATTATAAAAGSAAPSVAPAAAAAPAGPSGPAHPPPVSGAPSASVANLLSPDALMSPGGGLMSPDAVAAGVSGTPRHSHKHSF